MSLGIGIFGKSIVKDQKVNIMKLYFFFRKIVTFTKGKTVVNILVATTTTSK